MPPPSIMRPLLVGQAPGSAGDQGGALAGKAGERIGQCVGARRAQHAFDCVNLLQEYPGKNGKGDAFPIDAARAAAAMLERYDQHDRVVLLGRNVCRAFGFDDLAPLEERKARRRTWLHVPHPSGVNRWWNDEANVKAAGDALCRLIGKDMRQ